MKNKAIILIISILITCTVLVLLLLGNNTFMSKSYAFKDNKDIAVFIYDYEEDDYKSTTSIPVGDYELDEKSFCKNGSQILSYDSVKGTVKYKLDNADKCYLYFKENLSLAVTLIKKDSENAIISSQDGSSYIIKREEVEYNGTTYDAGVRYEGKDPDNYVEFNGGEEWRIIGSFEGSTIGLEPGEYYTKIIKSSSSGNYYWDDTGAQNDWTASTIRNYLVNDYLPTITTKSISLIASNATWYLGGAPSAAYTTYTLPQFYAAERGTAGSATSPTTLSYQGDVGLMYPTDYALAMYAGSANTSCTKDIVLYQYRTAALNCSSYDWLQYSEKEWTITSLSNTSISSFLIDSTGNIGRNFVDVGEYAVRPTLYLKSNVYITDGDGSKENPYKLEQKIKTFADTIIAKANNGEYTSSQDGSKYNISGPELNVPAATDDSYEILSRDGYGQTSEYKASVDSISGTVVDSVFSFDSVEGAWSNTPTSMTDGMFYNIVFPVEESASYQFCYQLLSAPGYNDLYVRITDKENSYLGHNRLTLDIDLNGVTDGYVCEDLGWLTSAQAIKVAHNTYYSASTGSLVANLQFYLKKTDKINILDNAGVRYQGKDPDNYIYFNGEELWRIIGVFEGSTIGLEPGKQYTKIIKEEALYNKSWSTGNTNNWSVATLNSTLNSTYLESLGSNSLFVASNATWYLGRNGNSYSNAAEHYVAERSNVGGGSAPDVISDKKTVGLINVSDYALAMYAGTQNAKCSIYLSTQNYDSDSMNCSYYNWLFFPENNAWTITPHSTSSGVRAIKDGKLLTSNALDSYAVHPVLYLKQEIISEEGDGSLENPYRLSLL